MNALRIRRHLVAALLVGAGLVGGGAVATSAGSAAPVTGVASRAAIQTIETTPDSTAATEDCEDEENGGTEDRQVEQTEDGAGDSDDDQGENGTDDAAEGDTEADTAKDEAAEDERQAEEENGEDDEAASAQPGTLTEGQDLLPQAKITVEQAITTARDKATGDLGTVELEDRDGTLVFEVTIGDQEVFVDATSGAIVTVEAVQNQAAEHEDGCADEGTVAPGTLDDGKELLPQATITVEQAIAAAQGAAQGAVGEVDLEMVDGTLVFNVDIGDNDVKVDAATGQVRSVDQDD